MTEPANGPRLPGTTLLKIARWLLNERVISAIVRPTISDLQREVADAGSSRVERLRARWRGYRAFWRVMLVAPFASWPSPAGDAGAVAFPDAIARLAFGSIVLALVAVAGPLVGASIAVLVAAAALFAIVIHRWYQQHPSELPDPPEPQKTATPQINFSSTEVGGNVGGLIFAVGTVLIVAVALPSTIWFILTAAVAACFLAWGLAAWHTSHPDNGRPDNQIMLR